MANQKIVLKVRYPEDQTFYAKGDDEYKPATITQWNYRRIVAAVILLGGVIGVSGYVIIENEKTGRASAVAATDEKLNEINTDTAKDIGGEAENTSDRDFITRDDESSQNEKVALDSSKALPIDATSANNTAIADQTTVQYPEDVSAGSNLVKAESLKETTKQLLASNDVKQQALVKQQGAIKQNVANVDLDSKQNDTSSAINSEATEVDSAINTSVVPVEEPIGPSPFVSRSLLVDDVQNLEPVNPVGKVLYAQANQAIQVSFFTELRDLSGDTVVHEWRLNGKEVFSKRFAVKGNRWRIYTKKLVNTAMLGDWEVRLKKVDGEVLDLQRFQLLAPSSSGE